MYSSQAIGIGTKLINESLQSIKSYLRDINLGLKAVTVSTRADNLSQSLYQKVLGAKTVATISNLYSYDEVLMIAREL